MPRNTVNHEAAAPRKGRGAGINPAEKIDEAAHG